LTLVARRGTSIGDREMASITSRIIAFRSAGGVTGDRHTAGRSRARLPHSRPIFLRQIYAPGAAGLCLRWLLEWAANGAGSSSGIYGSGG